MRAAKAFSLVELCVVIFLLAVAAGAVTLRMGPALGRVKMEDAADRVAGFDRLMRAVACQQDRALLMVVELDGGRLRLTDAEGRDLAVAPLELPDGFRFAGLLLGGRELRRGSAAISCSRQGLSPSYALRIEGPAGQGRWLLVCGLTGCAVQDLQSDAENDRNIRDVLASVAPRDDAR